MKRITLFLIAILFCQLSFSQVFNTSSTLGSGDFSVGFQPGIYASGATNFYLYLYGGVGITQGVDLGLTLGVLDPATYVGGDVEFALGKRFALTTGAHVWGGEFGLDGTGLFTFDLGKTADLFTGLDLDIIFSDEVYIPLWWPIGLEIGIKSNMAFIFETSINLTNNHAHWIGGGLNFYF